MTLYSASFCSCVATSADNVTEASTWSRVLSRAVPISSHGSPDGKLRPTVAFHHARQRLNNGKEGTGFKTYAGCTMISEVKPKSEQPDESRTTPEGRVGRHAVASGWRLLC